MGSTVGTPPFLKGGVNLFHNCHSWGVWEISPRNGGDKEKREGLIYNRVGITFLLQRKPLETIWEGIRDNEWNGKGIKKV